MLGGRIPSGGCWPRRNQPGGKQVTAPSCTPEVPCCLGRGNLMEHSAKTAKRLEEINRWLHLQGDMGIEEEEEKPGPSGSSWRQWLAFPMTFISNSFGSPKRPRLFFVGCGPGQLGQATRKYFTVPPGFADRFAEDLHSCSRTNFVTCQSKKRVARSRTKSLTSFWPCGIRFLGGVRAEGGRC